MVMEVKKSKLQYPILSGLTSIHLTPDGAWLSTKEQVEIDRSVIGADGLIERLIAFYPTVPVNQSARDFLLLCDGTKCYGEIIEILGNQHQVSIEEVIECIEPFYTKSMEKNHIGVIDSPHKHQVLITGHTDIFFPVHMQFDLTDECNMFCNYCYRSAKYLEYTPTTQSIPFTRPFEEVEAMFEKCIANGVRAVELSGGEPMMSLHFKDILRLLAKHGILVTVKTNGTFIDDEMADFLAKCGNVMLSVSLDGHNEKTNSLITRCIGGFQRTIHGLKALAERKVVFRVAATVCNENIDHMEELLLLAKDIGAVQFGFSMPMTFGLQKIAKRRDKELAQSLRSRFNRTWNQLVEKYGDFIAAFNNSTWNYHREIGNCGVGHRSFGVDPHGNIRVCTANTGKWSLIGNIYTDSYEEIFENPIVAVFRNLQAPTFDICGQCPQLVNCRNCVMRGIKVYQDMKEAGKSCQWANAFNIDEVLGDIDKGESSSPICAKIVARG